MDKDKQAFLRETLGSKGWPLILEWFSNRDKRLTEKIKKNFVNIKTDESVKWGWHFGGQYQVIADFETFIKNATTEKREIKKKTLP